MTSRITRELKFKSTMELEILAGNLPHFNKHLTMHLPWSLMGQFHKSVTVSAADITVRRAARSSAQTLFPPTGSAHEAYAL